jgi:uncharacterized BrkB/YihY/UPF0761 family membrane protein
MLIFTILVPLMIFAGACAPLISSFLRSTPPGRIPFINLFFSLASYGFGILCAWIFFLAIYMVVPNRRVSFRKSWLGALVAALLVQLYLVLFPLYVSHFLNTYTGSAGAIGFAVVLLFFLYYFAVILLLGAEVNAFVAEHIHATPSSLPGMLYQIAGYAPSDDQGGHQQQATTGEPERSSQEQAGPVLPAEQPVKRSEPAQAITSYEEEATMDA